MRLVKELVAVNMLPNNCQSHILVLTYLYIVWGERMLVVGNSPTHFCECPPNVNVL